MKLFILKLALTALAFAFVLPLIPGIDFHGNFLAAIMISIVFGIMLWVTDLIALAISTVLTVSSLGLALIWLIPLWILGFWLLPAVALRLVADVMPNNLTIMGWMPAIFGGLIMLFIGMLTSDSSRLRAQT
ncbi:MAG: phage holin family protein [Candidatus Obscuribacterales bacterium]|nr:phage holin family protein [Candidatus Obscuribacterales bacterium]